jgi:hypothetical protein
MVGLRTRDGLKSQNKKNKESSLLLMISSERLHKPSSFFPSSLPSAIISQGCNRHTKSKEKKRKGKGERTNERTNGEATDLAHSESALPQHQETSEVKNAPGY